MPYLPAGVRWFELGSKGQSPQEPVDLVAVEALEVSEKGDIAVSSHHVINGFEAGRWVVAAPILREDGGERIVKNCRLPICRKSCVELVLTELGVIGISPVGFELRELSPGAASDDVRMKVRASLHVADGIERLKI
ncbi:MAG: hypothetical protein JRI35_05275 [Deltaproteobacteria bacterium]|nr:hypothetical protein [Deltaproteobacteria bacterium]